VTLTPVEPVTDPTVACTVAAPCAAVLSNPPEAIVAIVVSVDAHVAVADTSNVLLSEYVPTAVYRCLPPTGTDSVCGVTAIDTSVGTVKVMPLLGWLDTVTTTGPVTAVAGTVAAMLVPLQLVVVAVTPLNFTVLLPFVAPKFEPAMVTEMPGNPDVGDRLEMIGAGGTVKLLPLLSTPPA
jgi:hypothetical protein